MNLHRTITWEDIRTDCRPQFEAFCTDHGIDLENEDVAAVIRQDQCVLVKGEETDIWSWLEYSVKTELIRELERADKDSRN